MGIPENSWICPWHILSSNVCIFSTFLKPFLPTTQAFTIKHSHAYKTPFAIKHSLAYKTSKVSASEREIIKLFESNLGKTRLSDSSNHNPKTNSSSSKGRHSNQAERNTCTFLYENKDKNS